MSHRILILVGTDHHAFARAVGWADRWAESHPADGVVIQYGRSAPPVTAEGFDFLSQDQLRDKVAAADVVITHGGPGTINDARHAGHRPIVFPRDPTQGEHVDDHQQRFAAWCRRQGLVQMARTTEELDELVAGLGEEGTRSQERRDPAAVAAVAAVGALIENPRARPVGPGAPVLLHVAGTDIESVRALESAFAQLPGVVALGALEEIWTSGVAHHGFCGCGLSFVECPLWVDIGQQAFGGWDWVVRAGHAARVEQAVSHRFAQRRRHPGRRNRERLLAAAAPYLAVVSAARRITGADLVVDAGSAGTALVLSHDRRLDLRVVHVGEGGGAFGYRRVPLVRVDPAEVLEKPELVADQALEGLGLTLPVGPASAAVSHPEVARLS